MHYRRLSASGLRVPVLTLGTGTFGGTTEFFKSWGTNDVAAATRRVDICLEAASGVRPRYPYWHQWQSPELVPLPV
jgi:aryl-alcohol dehydrogenase-like predicted oxidoreductase